MIFQLLKPACNIILLAYKIEKHTRYQAKQRLLKGSMTPQAYYTIL